jgi:hypothetical protein
MYKRNAHCPMSHHAPTYLLCGTVCAHHQPQELQHSKLVCGNGQYWYVHAICHVAYKTHGIWHVAYKTHGMHQQIHLI